MCRYLATCSADSTVKIWLITPKEVVLDKTLVGHQRWIWDAAFSADSAYLVTGASLSNGGWSSVADGGNGMSLPLCYYILASSDHVARLWEMATGETVRHYNGHHKGESSARVRGLDG